MFWVNSLVPLLLLTSPARAADAPLVDVTSVSPAIQVDMRYRSSFNFLGKPVNGYEAGKCLLTREAAAALAEAQEYIRPFGLTLLVLDCYRPQRAVSEFVDWVKRLGDETMKAHFFPDEEKRGLIRRGYIDGHSGHSRGSTVDLTLAVAGKAAGRERPGDCRHPEGLEESGQLDMGTGFDCFSDLAHTANGKVGKEARRNRLLLRAVMEKAGFVNYPKEWWHYTLKNEPFKDTYLDVPVR